MPELFPMFPRPSGDLNTDLASRCAQGGYRHFGASVVKHSVASVIARDIRDIVDEIPISEIAVVLSKHVRAPVVVQLQNLRSQRVRSGQELFVG
jgi:hypothetical protein